MKRKRTILLAFVPLIAGLIASGVVAVDATHPTLHTDTCKVLGTGIDAGPFKTGHPSLYRNGGNPVNDVALSCDVMGQVWLNEPNPLGLSTKAGKTATITVKTYQFLPKQWRIMLHK